MERALVSFALVAWMLTLPVQAYDLNVTAGAQNQVISGSKAYPIPKGTAKVSILYNIFSPEYPQYVTAQSIYNDVWSVSLLSDAGTLFEITRQVNTDVVPRN